MNLECIIPLTFVQTMLDYRQQTRQAYALRGMLKLGGFLLFASRRSA